MGIDKNGNSEIFKTSRYQKNIVLCQCCHSIEYMVNLVLAKLISRYSGRNIHIFADFDTFYHWHCEVPPSQAGSMIVNCTHSLLANSEIPGYLISIFVNKCESTKAEIDFIIYSDATSFYQKVSHKNTREKRLR